MSHDGPSFYDDAQVFDRYAQLRARAERVTLRPDVGPVEGFSPARGREQRQGGKQGETRESQACGEST